MQRALAGWLEDQGSSLSNQCQCKHSNSFSIRNAKCIGLGALPGLIRAINAALGSAGCLRWLKWFRWIQFQFKARQWKSDWARWIHHGSINMRLCGRLVVGAFYGSAVIQKTGRYLWLAIPPDTRGKAFGKRKGDFNCFSLNCTKENWWCWGTK